MPDAQERLNRYIAAGKALEKSAIQILADEQEISLEEFERLLLGGGDRERDRRERYQKMVDEKIAFLRDDGD